MSSARTTPEALTGWDEYANAQAYDAFASAFSMYSSTSLDLARRAGLTNSRLIVDLCGGTGVTARQILDLAPSDAHVVSLDQAAAMQRIGQRALPDRRLSWVTATAESLSEHIPAGQADAVVCNSALWKTSFYAVLNGVRQVLRPGGLFVFNIGGSFAGLGGTEGEGPCLDSLIHQIAAREHGYAPAPAHRPAPRLPLVTITRHLADAGMSVVDTDVITQHVTMAERKAWLSIPIFTRPEGDLTYEQRMNLLDKAYAQVRPSETRATRWLVVVARRPQQ